MTERTGQPKILVVDDEPLNVEILAGVLEQDGDILFATSGGDALAIARREQPDIVLLDIEMPDMSGLEVCRQLKAETGTADIPVIFVTAHDREADIDAGLDAGAADILAKPVHATLARARVRTHVELRRYRARSGRGDGG